jgi:hypothetical protein
MFLQDLTRFLHTIVVLNAYRDVGRMMMKKTTFVLTSTDVGGGIRVIRSAAIYPYFAYQVLMGVMFRLEVANFDSQSLATSIVVTQGVIEVVMRCTVVERDAFISALTGRVARLCGISRGPRRVQSLIIQVSRRRMSVIVASKRRMNEVLASRRRMSAIAPAPAPAPAPASAPTPASAPAPAPATAPAPAPATATATPAQAQALVMAAADTNLQAAPAKAPGRKTMAEREERIAAEHEREKVIKQFAAVTILADMVAEYAGK